MNLPWLRKLVDVRPHEVRALLWSFAYFFSVLCAYYILRPMRDEMGIIGGVKNLPWLFTATFFALLAAVPFYGLVVSKLPSRRFIPVVYRFFIANILIFLAGVAIGHGQGDDSAGLLRMDQRLQSVCGVGLLVVHGRYVPQ